MLRWFFHFISKINREVAFNMTTKKLNSRLKRALSTLLAMAFILSTAAAGVSAAGPGTNITVSTGTDLRLFEWYVSGAWTDLLTPAHTTSGGSVAYCLEHNKPVPSGAYNPFDPSILFDAAVQNGLVALLGYGYPNSNGGLSNGAARYATQNAIRFWLAERAGLGYPSIMVLSRVRPKPGNEAAYDFFLFLLEKARAGIPMTHAVSLTPETVKLAPSGNNLVGTATVRFVNLNGNYEIDTSRLPAGVIVTGYTGNDGDVLTVTVPRSMAGQSISIASLFRGYDTRDAANLFYYTPDQTTPQRVLIIGTDYHVVAYGNLNITSDALEGRLRIIKTSEDGVVANIPFTVTGNGFNRTVYTNTAGEILIEGLIEGTYTVTEAAPNRYVQPQSQTVTVVPDQTAVVSFSNTLKKFCVTVTKTDREYGTVQGGAKLGGAVYVL